MTLPDPKKYRHLLSDPSLTNERKDELILGMWVLMEGLFKKIRSGKIPIVPAEEPLTTDTKQQDSIKEGRGESSTRVRKKRKSSHQNTNEAQ